jgi:hypothetical protein
LLLFSFVSGVATAQVKVPGMAVTRTAGTVKPATLVFKRVYEPREHAFSLLIPAGWLTEGGIFRVNPTAQGGPAQSIAAKLDFAVKSDAQGTVMIRWLPDVLFFDNRNMPAAGAFPVGSNYNGMTVYPLVPAGVFLQQVAFPYAHPQAMNTQLVSSRRADRLAQGYQQRINAMMPGLGFSYDAAVITVHYQENGQSYEEKLTGVIENMGRLGTGMWGNKGTFLLRAPAGEWKKWEPVFSIIISSVKLDPRWVAGEIQAQIERGQIALHTQQEVQRLEREMLQHQQHTNAEIHNDMFLTLTDQEEYVNPFTHETETGSNQWLYRWENQNGDVIYTDQADYNPNHDINLHASGFKKTPVRKR